MFNIFSTTKNEKLNDEIKTLTEQLTKEKNTCNQQIKLIRDFKEREDLLEIRKLELDEKERNIDDLVNNKYSILENKLQEREKYAELLIQKITKNNENQDKQITLNIGGKLFCTTIDTLTKTKETFFSAMFSNYFNTKPNEKGEYFIDRDPSYTDIIIDYLRDEDVIYRINNMSQVAKQKLISDINFYGVMEMMSIIPQLILNIFIDGNFQYFTVDFLVFPHISWEVIISTDQYINQYEEGFYIGMCNNLNYKYGFSVSNRSKYTPYVIPEISCYSGKKLSYPYMDSSARQKTILVIYNSRKQILTFSSDYNSFKIKNVPSNFTPFVYCKSNFSAHITNLKQLF